MSLMRMHGRLGLAEREAWLKVTVVGLGNVGTGAAISLAVSGHEVLATDVDPCKLQALGAGVYEGYEPVINDN